MTPLVVTIDGPAAAGKSTTAREVARRLGCLYLDSGALYRALALKAARLGVSPDDNQAVRDLVQATEVDLVAGANGPCVLLDGEDVSDEVRQPAISELASRFAERPAVREHLVETQRRMAVSRSLIAEGRDTGSVVFPDAAVKVYLDASLEERAGRRFRELAARGVETTLEEVRDELDRRDRRDRERRLAPLAPAADSVVVDTTNLTPDQQVEAVLRVVRARPSLPAAGAPGETGRSP